MNYTPPNPVQHYNPDFDLNKGGDELAEGIAAKTQPGGSPMDILTNMVSGSSGAGGGASVGAGAGASAGAADASGVGALSGSGAAGAAGLAALSDERVKFDKIRLSGSLDNILAHFKGGQ